MFLRNRVKLKGILVQIFCMASVLAVDQNNQNETGKIVKQMFDGVNIMDIIFQKFNESTSKSAYENLDTTIDFSAPGRRISEEKCLDIIWKTKFTELIDLMLYGKKGIIGGRPAYYGEVPHMGAIGWKSTRNDIKWEYKCGATLISETFLLTAAHCSRARRGDPTIADVYPKIVKLGDEYSVNEYLEVAGGREYDDPVDFFLGRHKNLLHRSVFADIPEEGIIRYEKIKRFINHKDYKSPKHYYDIAIIELENSVSVGPLIRPACLWSIPDTSGLDKLLISGWGIIDAVTKAKPTELQIAEVNRIPDKVCDEKLLEKRNRNWRGLADHQICAGFLPGGIDSCEGDSGGPLQFQMALDSIDWPMYYLVGVTSFGYNCAKPDNPGVYVKIASFIDWIEKTVWPDG